MITSRRASSIARCLLLAAVAVLLAPALHAQMPPSSSTTSTPVPGAGHDYLGELAETVNPATGSVSVRLNAMMPPGRGLTLPFSFGYDSNGVNYVTLNPAGSLSWAAPPSTVASSGGWSNSVPMVSFAEINWTAYADQGAKAIPCWAFVNYVYQDAHADRHNLDLTTYNQAGTDGPCTYYTPAPPGFGWQVVTQGGDGEIIASIPSNATSNPGPVTVADPDGTVLYFPLSISDATIGAMATAVEDRNGNLITINSAGQGKPYSYVDTAGRTVLQDSGFGVSPETVTIAGLNAAYTLTWTPLSTPSFVAPVTTLTGNACNFGGVHTWGPQEAVSSLKLPNLKSFSFTYDPTYQVLNKMTYPTGGYVRYVWGMNPQAEFGQYMNSQPNDQCTALYGVPVITDRYVSFNGTTEVLHQHFAYSTTWNSAAWTSKQTTVTTTDNVRNTSYNTVYTYHPLAADVPPNTGGAPTSWDPVEYSTAYYDTSGTLLKTVYKTWSTPSAPLSEETQYPSGQADETTWSYNSREQQIERDDYDFGTSGVGSLLRKTITNYQAFNDTPLYPNAPSIVDRACQVITYDSTGTNRVAETDYFYDNGATTTACGTAGTPSVTGAGGSSLTGHDETNYSASSTYPRGNLTEKTQWLNTGTSPVTTYTYDETGQVLSMTDACGNGTCSDMSGSSHTTTYSYTDSFLNTNSTGFTTTGGSPPSGKVTNAYLTKVTDALAHVEKFSYGYNDGELTQSSDQNSQLTTYKYNDSLGRQTETDYPDTGQTTLSYNDSTPSVTTTKLISSSVSLSTTAVMDGLGHVTQTQLTTDPDGTTYTATVYDGNGRTYQTYNPTRCSPPTTNCGTETTWGITTSLYDTLGRPCLVVRQDFTGTIPSTCPTTGPLGTAFTSYSANLTTVIDEVGNQRTSQVDGLGRSTYVWEAPNVTGYNFETIYQYDGLNNLTNVTQNGSNSANARNRSFQYDSLSRLTQAVNPESGTITYNYDVNGNVSTKVAPKPGQTGTMQSTTTYSYDVLNRLTEKSYANPYNSTDQYAYDGGALTCNMTNPPTLSGATNLIGRRSAMCGGPSGSSFSYDPMGRLAVEDRNSKGTSLATYKISYLYYEDGSLKQLTYPSGDVLTYTPGGAGRPIGVNDSSTHYVANGTGAARATYAPQGALAGMVNGYASPFTGIVTSNVYNDRLQPILLSASLSSGAIFSLCYDFHTQVAISSGPCSFGASAGDNGSVFQILNNVDSTRSSKYIYDPLNRIAQAYTINGTSGNCWAETYASVATAPGVLPPVANLGIDSWSNLIQRSGVTGMGSCKTEGSLGATASTNNQLSIMSYDAAGNVLNDGNGNQPTYDDRNRISTDAGYTYSYDADDVRMGKANGSTGTMYWPGPGGEVLSESDLTGTINEEYVYFNGERIARIDRPTGTVNYYFSNHLGSASVITSATGVIQEQMDFYPFGGVAYSSGSDPNHYKFTGKERDSESGLDNFGARYFTSSLGRFMTPDWAARPTAVPYAVFGDPQSLNLYTYVRNDPVTHADANGHCLEDACVIETLAGATILVMATQAYFAMPASQRDYGASLSQTAHSLGTTIGGWFSHPSNSGANASTPATVPTNVSHGTPASTSQQGAVNNGPLQSVKPSDKDAVRNAAGGHCEYCGQQTVPGEKSQPGVSPPGNEGQTDHYHPQNPQPGQQAGTDDRSNLVHACRDCNQEKSNSQPEGTRFELPRMQTPSTPTNPSN
jgi:RHS repeat-associated protein